MEANGQLIRGTSKGGEEMRLHDKSAQLCECLADDGADAAACTGQETLANDDRGLDVKYHKYVTEPRPPLIQTQIQLIASRAARSIKCV